MRWLAERRGMRLTLPEVSLDVALTFDVRGRRSGEAAKGTHKRSLWAVPLDGMVMPHDSVTSTLDCGTPRRNLDVRSVP
jgi:hypothetical protein